MQYTIYHDNTPITLFAISDYRNKRVCVTAYDNDNKVLVNVIYSITPYSYFMIVSEHNTTTEYVCNHIAGNIGIIFGALSLTRTQDRYTSLVFTQNTHGILHLCDYVYADDNIDLLDNVSYGLIKGFIKSARIRGDADAEHLRGLCCIYEHGLLIRNYTLMIG